MTIADAARDNAIAIELKKDGLSQRQSGDWVVRFTVQSADMDERLTKAAMGTRFVAALVEVGDDEQPRQSPQAQGGHARADKLSPERRSEIAQQAAEKRWSRPKGEWRDLTPAAQASLRCKDGPFRAFLSEEKGRELGYEVRTEEYAAIAVRELCGVKSRSELSTNHAARVIWHGLDSEYQAWKAL
jgi:hypothetical protein